MRSVYLFVLCLACKPADDPPADTSGLTDDPLDTADEPVPWWDGTWAYRVPVLIESPASIDGIPQLLSIDLDAQLADVGDASGFEPGSARVVASSGAVWPAQRVEDVGAFLDGGSTGDVVAFVPEGHDAPTLEAWLYFGSADQPTGASLIADAQSASAEVPSNRLSTGSVSAELDPERGGVLAAMSAGGTTLASQADSLYGNGLNADQPPGGWLITPMSDAGDVEVLASGPVVAGMRASGLRANGQGSYAYQYDYWVFAGRPEVWTQIWLLTTGDSIEGHGDDFTRGIRPWQSRHDAIVDGGETERATDDERLWTALASPAGGVALGWRRPPTHVGRMTNDSDPGGGQRHYYVVIEANDFMPEGEGTPYTIPAQTVLVDHRVLVATPTPTVDEASDRLAPLVATPTTTVGTVEAAP